MNIYSGLLFLHGHIADAGLARRLAEPVQDDPTGEAPGDAAGFRCGPASALSTVAGPATQPPPAPCRSDGS